MLVTRTVAAAAKRAAAAGGFGAVAAAARRPFFAAAAETAVPSSFAAAAATTSIIADDNNIRLWRRRASSTPPLSSPPNDDGGGGGDADGGSEGEIAEQGMSDEKRATIDRWMKWNQSKTWRYVPNHDLIARIGKEGAARSPLDQFRDLVPIEKRSREEVGRSWSVRELRRKSYDDLHKLWYVLYKERNMLLTESNLARRHAYEMVQPDRRKKVRKSMGAIKHVLGERKRRKIAAHRAYVEKAERFRGLLADVESKQRGGDDGGGGGEMEEAMDGEAERLSTKE